MAVTKNPLMVAGIDVGGPRKGFHAVALRGGKFHDQFQSAAVKDVAAWCRGLQARVIAIDAPCRWSQDGRARPAERELMRHGIWCFSTPKHAAAKDHPNGYFDWMLRGAALFAALEPTHTLVRTVPLAKNKKHTFETFPQAIACALSGAPVSAKHKRTVRRALLEKAGIDTATLTNIDWVDAALCALAAHRAAAGRPCAAFGEAKTGLIIVPAA